MFGFVTPRTGTDIIARFDNDDGMTDPKLVIRVDGVRVYGDLEVDETLDLSGASARIVLPVGTDLWAV